MAIRQPRTRYLRPFIEEDLGDDKMAFLGGPRQVGKTTLARSFLGASGGPNHPAYLNWDSRGDRERLRREELPAGERLVVLDEIHKFARWRNMVKGFYDKYHHEVRFIVTGSARLDYYRKGGDSLAGRYRHHRLHPFSVGELGPSAEMQNHLLAFGGFPEPCLKANARTLRRWQQEHIARIVEEDLRDLENVREVSLVELLVDALPQRIGSPLSVPGLAEDLQVAPKTVDRWIEILDRLYVCFRIAPWGAPKIRAVKKERKLYLWDWSTVENPGARFENMVACQLLKYCHFMEDTEGFKMELRFLRDFDTREVDFVVLKDRKPIFAVECKTGEMSVSPHLAYFRARTPIPTFYQVHLGKADYGNAQTTVRVAPFFAFCKELGLP